MGYYLKRLGPFQPCPFCASSTGLRVWVYSKTIQHQSTSRRTDRFLVRCLKCRAGGPQQKTEVGAVRSWNRRQ